MVVKEQGRVGVIGVLCHGNRKALRHHWVQRKPVHGFASTFVFFG